MKERIWIVASTMIVAAVFGSVVSGIYLGSQDTLERNRTIRRQRAFAEVFGYENVVAMRDVEISTLVEARIEEEAKTVTDPQSGTEFIVIKAYDTKERRRLKGV